MDFDKNGKFAKGNKAHSGFSNKGTGRTPDEYKRILIAKLTPEVWKEILDKAIEQAKNGDDKARKFLSDHSIGSPQQKVDITTLGDRIGYSPIEGLNYAQCAEYFSGFGITLPDTDKVSETDENTDSEKE